MKVSSVVRTVLGVLFAFAVSQVHADQMGDLCTILNTGRNNLAALNRQIANESNPLKKDALQQRSRQINQQTNASLDNFFKINRLQIVNYTGTVSSLSAEHYNTGPGVMLGIALPCRVSIAVQFIEITNPALGNLNPDNQTPLPPFRPVLENLAVHDSVTFSGRLPHDEFSRHFMNSPDGLSFFAVLTELGKKGGIAYKVPDSYLPPAPPPRRPVFFKEGKNDNDRQQDESVCGMAEINGQLKGKTWIDCMVQKGWQVRPLSSEPPKEEAPRPETKSGELSVPSPPPAPAPAPKTPVTFSFYPRLGQSKEQQSRDNYDCTNWAIRQTGYDPHQSHQSDRQKNLNFQRALGACLEGRGYTVKLQ